MNALSANTMGLNEPKRLDLSAPDIQNAVSILIAHEHALCRGDEDAADELLADLEPHLRRLDWPQNEWLRGLSGDLHMLNDEEVLEPSEQSREEYREALRNAWRVGTNIPSDSNDLLALLRKEQDILTSGMVSFGRAGAYRSLGFPQLALEFGLNAVRLEPDGLNGLIYQTSLLEDLRIRGEVKRATDLGLRLLNSSLTLPMIVLAAVATLHLIAIRLPEEEGRPLLGQARRRVESLLKHPGLDKMILAPALLLQGNLYWALRRNAEAQRFFSDAIRLDPEDDVPYVAMGLLLQQNGDPKGASYFERVIEKGTELAMPFLGLAQYALSDRNYQACRKLSSQALAHAKEDRSRGMANALIGLAIFHEHGPTEEAREYLRVGVTLYPENEALCRSYDEVERAYREKRPREAWNIPAPNAASLVPIYSPEMALRSRSVLGYGLNDLAENQRQARMRLPIAA